jgi:glycerol uptake facilitator protein
MASARRTLFGELCAEFAGTLILILFGVGVVAQVVTSHGAFGDHDSIAWGWGLGAGGGARDLHRSQGQRGASQSRGNAGACGVPGF